MKTILLLHGALGAARQLFPIRDMLARDHDVHTINFSGHGGVELKTTFAIDAFAKEVLDYVEENNLNNIGIFGYSMGGYVALYLAKHHPEVVAAVATLGTKLHWDAAIAAREISMLQPKTILEKVPAFAAELKSRHEPLDWEKVVEQTAALMQDIGDDCPLPLHEFEKIQCPVLLSLGDRDNMVTLVETVSVFKQLPKGQLAVLPATAHPIEKVNVDQLHYLINNFFKSTTAVSKKKKAV